jgi:hypothetical protein
MRTSLFYRWYLWSAVARSEAEVDPARLVRVVNEAEKLTARNHPQCDPTRLVRVGEGGSAILTAKPDSPPRRARRGLMKDLAAIDQVTFTQPRMTRITRLPLFVSFA